MSGVRSRRNAASKRTPRPGTLKRATPTVSIGIGFEFQSDVRPANQNDVSTPLVLLHGRYEVEGGTIRSSLEEPPQPRVVNRSVTVIDDWIEAGLFERRQVRTIEMARDLWRDIRFPRHPLFDPPDLEDRNDSFDSERAKNLLRRCRALVGRGRWYIFENVVRWNEPTGIPGSRIASVTHASVGAAQQIVREVAEQIRSIL